VPSNRTTGLTFPGIGARIKQRVKELGYKNVGDFARDKKLDKGSVYAWAEEKRSLSDGSLALLEKHLEVPWQWLVIGDEGEAALQKWRASGVAPSPLKGRLRAPGIPRAVP
jgi:hypothetical protein